MMPGTSDIAKAKVTSAAAAVNGVFVRPVAVAGIFRPAQEDPSKPPALPEKRRFSALVGDLQPCSSGGESPAAEDFNRRRQSWDTRQKETPFGQALLRKTPRSLPAKPLPGKPETDAAASNGCEVHVEATVKRSDSVRSSSAVTVTSVVTSSSKKVTLPSSASQNGEDSKSNGHDVVSQSAEFVISKKSNKITVIEGGVATSHENTVESKTATASDGTKQAKKVYGLVKRESKTENLVPNQEPTANSSTETEVQKFVLAKPKVYGLRTVKKEPEVVKEEKPAEAIQISQVSAEEQAKKTDSSTFNDTKSKAAAVTSKVETDVRVSKSPPKDFRTVRRTSDVIAAKIQNIFSNFQSDKPSSSVLKKTKTPGKPSASSSEPAVAIGNGTAKIDFNSVSSSVSVEKNQTAKSATPVSISNNKVSQEVKNDAKVITKDINLSLTVSQNSVEKNTCAKDTKIVTKDTKIVTKDTSVTSISSSKPVLEEKKTVTSVDLKTKNQSSGVDSKSSLEQKSSVVQNDTKIKDIATQSKTVPEKKGVITLDTKTKDQNLSTRAKIISVQEKKSTVVEDPKSSLTDKNLSSKLNTGKLTKESGVNAEKLATAVKNVDKPGSKSAEPSNIQGVKLEPPLKKADSKTEHSINAASSKPGDKKIPNIEGKMPIKKENSSSSDGTKALEAANQETDRKSSDPAAPSGISVNKGAGAKKMLSVASNIAEVTDHKSPAAIVSSLPVNGAFKRDEVKTVKQSSEGKVESKSVVSVSKTVTSQSFVSSGSVQLSSTTTNSFVNGNHEVSDISKVEVARITPVTTPGIVPTVNVLFRTKSPSGPPNREENRKKVLIETCASDTPISSAVIISPQNQTTPTPEVLKTLESVKQQQTPTASPRLPKKHAILNLQKQEVFSVDLSNNGASAPSVKSKTIESPQAPSPSSKTIDPAPTKPSTMLPQEPAIVSQTTEPAKTASPVPLHHTPVEIVHRIHTPTSPTPYSSVVDLGDWSKKFQLSEPDLAPRAPLRRRSQRESMPPLRSTPTRYGSLKRVDDSPLRYLPRSPSHSSLPPQRYSYTEMLSKVCSMGVLPYREPGMSKSCSSSSSQVSELWSELSEEQSNATHASEMLEAETTERMRLEKEVHELQGRYSQVQQRSNKMEMEILESRVYRSPEVNGDLSEDEDPDGTGSLYKQKYERAVRDMEIMKRRIQQQHEEEMEQKSMLKKATDKRLAEALEDVDEERQIANQWKRKAQKSAAELQDIRLMLEEQMARNGELEKKQRRFDAELSAAQEEIKKERLLREKLSREKDQAVNEKYSLDQELQSTKLDSDLLHEKIAQLNRELDELTLSSKGEEEVTQLKRAKQELERKNRDQEEELEELTAQVQMLEQAKLRLEMSLEKLRQEHRREASVREEEVEEIRASFSKKIKNLEAQLESEQDERHQLVKQKHELERRIYELTDQPPPQDPEIERRLRRDLKRTKALLRDAQSMLEHTREGQSSKTLIRQLKNQLEDSEFAKAAAIKARQAVETELQECQLQLEEVSRTKNEAETRCLQLSREKSAIQTQLEEAEEEMAEVMKKYKAVVAQMSNDQKTLAELNQQIAELETERQMLKDQLSEVSHKFEHLAGQSDDTHKMHWLDGKVRDLESKLELEQTTKTRLENQIARLKEQNERAREECDSLRNKELQAQEAVRRLQRQIRDLREDYSALQQKEADGYRKQHELEMALENTETDLQVTKNDLRLACQRIQDLQNALEDELDSGTDVPDDSGSDSDTSFDLSALRNQSLTPIQRCESIASNLSYDTAEGPRSRTSSFTRELSAFSSRDDAKEDVNGLPGLNTATSEKDEF